jgi:acyl-CoA synthetase (AMP-forming)/AMP-acid ligase II
MEFCRTPFLESLMRLPPSSLIFSEGKRSVRAGDLYQKAVALAVGLRHSGFKEGDRIVLIVPPGAEFLELFFACSMLRGIIVVIDPDMGRDNFESKLRQIDPQWMAIDSRLLLLQEHPLLRWAYQRFAKGAFYFSLNTKARVISVGKYMPLIRSVTHLRRLYKEPPMPLSFKDHPESEFMVTYTSGTLAEPKGVVHSVSSLSATLTRILELLSSTDQVRIAAYLPHFLLFGICSGNPVFLYDRRRPADWIIQFLEEHRITTLFGPPSYYLRLIDYCIDAKRKLPESLQLVILGSAPVHPKFLTLLYDMLPARANVVCLYGMTENLFVAAIDGRDKINTLAEGDVVGKLVEGVTATIAPDGEVMINSPQLFSRYLHLKERETPHATGDLGYFDGNGTLVLNGRKKDMIIRRDTNIYPAIYEKTIKNIPGVKEAVMIGLYSESKHDEEVYLIIESEGHTEEGLMKLLQAGKYSIDKEALPDVILFRNIPISGRQDKVDRKALRAALTE